MSECGGGDEEVHVSDRTAFTPKSESLGAENPRDLLIDADDSETTEEFIEFQLPRVLIARRCGDAFVQLGDRNDADANAQRKQ